MTSNFDTPVTESERAEMLEEIYWLEVPAVDMDDPRLRVAVSVVGGGVIGREYTAATWEYALVVDTDRSPDWYFQGTRLNGPWSPIGHHDMAVSFCKSLALIGEDWTQDILPVMREFYRVKYGEVNCEFLSSIHTRLAAVAEESEAQ
ncbi:hypothetical protein [Salininema proteolyticum]|uniref:Uncharacterized protein n=1 Tax=Salininema proteolyticum TaxID=1607685 RepID=A0ABV8U086_9ACTN